VTIAFDTILGDCAKTLKNPALCSELHWFGPDEEAYEMPAVMACCKPFGVGGTIYDLRWASNASPITARRTATGWSLDSFVIDHEDSKGQRWTVTVPPSFWSNDPS